MLAPFSARLTVGLLGGALLASAFSSAVFAQTPADAASPEAAPVPGEATASTQSGTPDVSVTTPGTPATTNAAPAMGTTSTETPATGTTPADSGAAVALPGQGEANSRLFAAKITYRGGLIIADGTPDTQVRFESSLGMLQANHVELDTLKKIVDATGDVNLERETLVTRHELRSRVLVKRTQMEKVRETAFGRNLHYDFGTGQGSLDAARLQTAQAAFNADKLLINGKKFTAQNVVLRPGALTPEEQKIYGTPPFNIRAKDLTFISNAGAGQDRLLVHKASLYFKNLKLLPIPSYAFRVGGRQNDPSAPKLTPGISFNSADRVLVTGTLAFPVSKNPERLSLLANIGLSERVGVRGGASVVTNQPWGTLTLGVQRKDIISTQLTNRIELDRKPELAFVSRPFATFNMPGNRRAGFTLDAAYGKYTESTIGSDPDTVSSDRVRARILFTTRLRDVDGAFLRLFRTYSRYGDADTTYNNNGLEVGYDGNIIPRVRGQIALRLTDIEGSTPFRFDRVEIARELRTTVDVTLTPRYVVPLDLRYDLSRDKFRDATFGLLRSYKTFAYGIVYQTSRHDLRLEVRNGF